MSAPDRAAAAAAAEAPVEGPPVRCAAAEAGPIHHIAGLPNWRGHSSGSFARFPGRPPTLSQRWANDFLEGGLCLPVEAGIHFLSHSQFRVTLTDAAPMFCLGDHPDVLAHVLQTRWYAQPGKYANGAIAIPPARAKLEPLKRVVGGRTFTTRGGDSWSMDAKNTVVLQVLLSGIVNGTTAPVGLMMGHKYCGAHRVEPGPAVAVPGETVARAFTHVVGSLEKTAELQAVTRPDYQELSALLQSVPAELVSSSLSEEFGRAYGMPDYREVDTRCTVGKNIASDIEDGVVPRAQVSITRDDRGGEKYIVHYTIVDVIKLRLQRAAARLDTLGELRDLGNFFVHAEPVESVGTRGGVPRAWAVEFNVHLVVFPTNVVDGLPRLDDQWIHDPGP